MYFLVFKCILGVCIKMVYVKNIYDEMLKLENVNGCATCFGHRVRLRTYTAN